MRQKFLGVRAHVGKNESLKRLNPSKPLALALARARARRGSCALSVTV